MCGRFIQYSHPEVYAVSFDLDLGPASEERPVDQFRPRYNLAPSQDALVIRLRPDGSRYLQPLRWGLIPFWSKGPDHRYQMINARAETLVHKPAYRAAFRQRRCIVPAEGFYEWRTEGRLKQPYLIRRADRRPFAMAGIWEHWRDATRHEGGVAEISSFTIIVTTANAVIQPLHDRMPVILSPEHLAAWLDSVEQDPDRLLPLLQPAPPEAWTLEPVGTRVNNPRNDDPTLIEPVGQAPQMILKTAARRPEN